MRQDFRRALRALAAAGALSAVAATCVYTEFAAARAKLVQAPVSSVSGRVSLTDLAPPEGVSLEPPFAVIARIRNESPSARTFTISFGGASICSRTVGGASTGRIDCASPARWNGKASAAIASADGADRWALASIEFATHHGATQDYDLIIVPTGSHRYVSVAAPVVAIVFLLVAGFLFAPGALPNRFHLTMIHRVAAGGVSLFLALVFVSRFVSPFAVILSGEAFFWCCLTLAAPNVWSACDALARRVRGRERIGRVLTAVALLLVVVCYGSLVARRLHETHHDNVSGFLHISRDTFNRDPLLSGRDDIRRTLVLSESGYDGEFMYFAVYDPFLWHFRDHREVYRSYVDAVPYRYGRIGYSLLAKVLSFDRWQWYPATMMCIVFGSILACALLVSALAATAGMSPLWGAAIIFVPGFWQSIQVGLPEPLAAALLVGGYLAVRRQHRWWGAGLFAASLLVRETGVIFVLAVAVITLSSTSVRTRLSFLAAALAPVAIWRLYVGTMLLKDWGPSVYFYHPGDLGLPFSGIAQLWTAVAHGQYYPWDHALQTAAIDYPVLLVFATAFALLTVFLAWGAPALAAAAYGAMALCLNFEMIWNHVGNAQRGTFEVFVMLLLATIELGATRRRTPWIALAFWAAAGAYVFWGAFDASFIRFGLPL